MNSALRLTRTTQSSSLLPIAIVILAHIHHFGTTALSSSSPSSLLSSPLTEAGRLKLRLDVGLQPNSSLPKRRPGWGKSGARLGVDVHVDFTSLPSTVRESFVGGGGKGLSLWQEQRESTIFKLDVVGSSGDDDESQRPRSTFVSERGIETVVFESGGWCLQRTDERGESDASVSQQLQPDSWLRFWLDCPSGAKRNDAEIFPDSRIFFTVGVWENKDDAVQRMSEEYRHVSMELEDLVDRTAEERSKVATRSNSKFDDLVCFQRMAEDKKAFEWLTAKKGELERRLPPRGAQVARNGVVIAPVGEMVINGNPSIPDWLPGGAEYLLLGTFSTKACEEKQR